MRNRPLHIALEAAPGLCAALALPAVLSCSCSSSGGPDVDSYRGVVINEIAAHDEVTDIESWVELMNTSSESIDLSGLGLYLRDEWFEGKQLCALDGICLPAGGRMVLSTSDCGLKTGFASDADFELRLAPGKDGDYVDVFQRGELSSLPRHGSYQRIPDGSGTFACTLAATKGAENIVRGVDNTKHNAIWMWGAHLEQWLSDDAAVMRQMKALGYDHVLLNYSGFKTRQKLAHDFMEAAAENGMTVHAWLQCFNDGSWHSPVIDEENRYNQELFDSKIAEAIGYIDEFGVQGIHLDYVRFPGTAYKHNPSDEVTGQGAVTEFCRQMREAIDAHCDGIILSAAMMAEENAAYYYGQNAAQMGQYIDILMPMVYRYQEGGTAYSADWCRKMVRLFTTVTDAPVWAGTQTYSYSGTGVSGLTAQQLLSDCGDFTDSGASGIVLFRYALGTFPDVNQLWDE